MKSVCNECVVYCAAVELKRMCGLGDCGRNVVAVWREHVVIRYDSGCVVVLVVFGQWLGGCVVVV
jgi:hypothetical protein